MVQVNKILRRLLCEQWVLLAFALPLSFLGSLQEFTTPFFIGRILDSMEQGNKELMRLQIILWVGFLLTGSFFAAIKDYLYLISSERIGKKTRLYFFKSIIKKDIGFFDEQRVGNLLSRLQQDTQIVQNGLTTNVAALLKSCFTVIGIIGILFFYSTKMTLFTILFVSPGSMLMPMYGKLTRFTQSEQQTAKAKASASATECFGNIRTVKAHASEEFAKTLYDEDNDYSL